MFGNFEKKTLKLFFEVVLLKEESENPIATIQH